MWIIGNSSRRRTISTGSEVIVAKCSFPASEQLSGNRFSATESWTVGIGYLRWLWMRILCRRSNQEMTDTAKMVAGLKNLTYVQRLERLNLTTLEERRNRGDLIEMYKLLTEKENVDYRQFFQKEDNQHR